MSLLIMILNRKQLLHTFGFRLNYVFNVVPIPLKSYLHSAFHSFQKTWILIQMKKKLYVIKNLILTFILKIRVDIMGFLGKQTIFHVLQGQETYPKYNQSSRFIKMIKIMCYLLTKLAIEDNTTYIMVDRRKGKRKHKILY